MAISLVQSISANGGGYVQNATATFGSNVTAGNLIVVLVASAQNITSLSDGLGNTYTKIDADITADSKSGDLWYAKNITGGSCTITSTTTNYNDTCIIAFEFSGLDTTAPLDQHTYTNESGYVTSHSSGSTSTTTQADELVIGAYNGSANDAGYAAGATFTGLVSKDGADLYTSAGMEYKTVSSTGTQSADMTTSQFQRGCMFVATFKAASAPPVTSDAANPVAGYSMMQMFW